jgi:hypothetical protein
MKKFFLCAGVLALLFLTSCSKPKVTCEIVSPTPNTTFQLGDVIEIIVEAGASNTTVSEVQIYLDNVGYENRTDFPYIFQIETYNLKEGVHTIRAVALAEDGTKDEATVSFVLAKFESPDFVTFSEGKFPQGWKIGAGWAIFSPGFDDDFCIKRSPHWDDELSAIKTSNEDINCIEFYAKDDMYNWTSTEISFYIDYHLIGTIRLTKSWEKYTFDMLPGEHTYRWWITSSGSSCTSYLDAIRFYKK